MRAIDELAGAWWANRSVGGYGDLAVAVGAEFDAVVAEVVLIENAVDALVRSPETFAAMLRALVLAAPQAADLGSLGERVVEIAEISFGPMALVLLHDAELTTGQLDAVMQGYTPRTDSVLPSTGGDRVWIDVSQDEALVLLERLSQSEEIIDGLAQPEKFVLWNLVAMLEKQVDVLFSERFAEELDAARARLIEHNGLDDSPPQDEGAR